MTPDQISALSNDDLDTTFSSAWNSGNGIVASLTGSEIASRLASPWSFIKGVFGSTTFPLYSAIMERTNGVLPQSQSAQQAVSDSAKNVAGKLEFFGGSFMVVVALVAIAYIVFRYKK